MQRVWEGCDFAYVIGPHRDAVLTKIEALNYRSLRYVSQRLSPFQILIGPNGSGKSSFLDVVAFLGDLLRVGPYAAIHGDGGSVAPRAADLSQVTWMRAGGRFELAVELAIPQRQLELLGDSRYQRARYAVAIESVGKNREIRLAGENLLLIPGNGNSDGRGERTLFPMSPNAPQQLVLGENQKGRPGERKVLNKIVSSGNDYFLSETTQWNNSFRLGPSKSALANLPEDEERFPVAIWVKRVLMEGVRRVVLNAETIRRPSPPGSPSKFRPDGSNLPWAIMALYEENRERFEKWIQHLQTAIPDLVSITTIVRPEDNSRYLEIEYSNGLKAPSWVVSDGTLRLLALSLLAYVENVDGIYLIEEPENGIHPRAVETVFQSIRSVYDGQVFCASHSPVILGLADPAALLCFAKTEFGETDIVRGDEHARLRKWKGEIDLGTLFASGVLQ
ncbi:MAG: AAA family ATPase [Phycisphaerales bacterium]|nr:AAA family ATPase [Phycisphaerales bacterium]